MIDRRPLAAARAVETAEAFERSRAATFTVTAAGDAGANHAVRAALIELGAAMPHRASADMVSRHASGLRVIEIKGRSAVGPIEIVERELDTLASAGANGWLYVVWNTLQPVPTELWIVPLAADMAWQMTQAALRPPGSPRGVRHEARYQISAEEIAAAGTCALKLPGLPPSGN